MILKTNIKERILEFAHTEEKFKQDFFKKTGLNYSNFTGTNKNSDVGSKVLAIILKYYPKADINWFLTGIENNEATFKEKYYSLLEKNNVLQSKLVGFLEAKTVKR
tara:strand:+ start:9309 stop:9626 length:318 start_codon:yes stop_codon:yes gene_type:complete